MGWLLFIVLFCFVLFLLWVIVVNFIYYRLVLVVVGYQVILFFGLLDLVSLVLVVNYYGLLISCYYEGCCVFDMGYYRLQVVGCRLQVVMWAVLFLLWDISFSYYWLQIIMGCFILVMGYCCQFYLLQVGVSCY